MSQAACTHAHPLRLRQEERPALEAPGEDGHTIGYGGVHFICSGCGQALRKPGEFHQQVMETVLASVVGHLKEDENLRWVAVFKPPASPPGLWLLVAQCKERPPSDQLLKRYRHLIHAIGIDTGSDASFYPQDQYAVGAFMAERYAKVPNLFFLVWKQRTPNSTPAVGVGQHYLVLP